MKFLVALVKFWSPVFSSSSSKCIIKSLLYLQLHHQVANLDIQTLISRLIYSPVSQMKNVFQKSSCFHSNALKFNLYYMFCFPVTNSPHYFYPHDVVLIYSIQVSLGKYKVTVLIEIQSTGKFTFSQQSASHTRKLSQLWRERKWQTHNQF